MESLFDRLFARIGASWKDIPPSEFLSYIEAKCELVLTKEKLEKLLNEKRILRVKLGIDPSGADLHLGHVAALLLLSLFQKAGHHIDLIFGDFTARIGDPTDRDSPRVPLSEEEIARNVATYKEQAGRYIRIGEVSLHYNSQWLAPMGLAQVLEAFQKVSLSEAIQREDFRNRLKKGRGVTLAEMAYGALMGLDSLHLQTDVEVGAIDQLLNFQQTRELMRESDVEEEVIAMAPLVESTAGDGRKMSKSFQNYVAVNASSEEKFGKIMSIPDRLIEPYYRSFTFLKTSELDELHSLIHADPLEAKKQLAMLVVGLETGTRKAAQEERERFERKFSQHVITRDDSTLLAVKGGTTIMEALSTSGAFASKSEVRRLFQEQAVRLITEDAERVLEPDTAAKEGMLLRAGKRKFFTIHISNNQEKNRNT